MALEAAASQAVRLRASVNVEPVWTGPTLPFDGVGSKRGARVTFVMETRVESVGKITFDPALGLHADVEALVHTFVWPMDHRARDEKGQHGTLHAKFVVADGASLFVASANLTDFALNLNIELGVLIRGGSEPRRAYENLRGLIQRKILRPIR